MPTINDSVQFLKGVGPAFAKKFEKLGILTIRDLLLCYPRKYIDYTQPYTYRLGANSCLSGDFMSAWRFDHELKIGENIIFEDMIHYTTVKTTMFNGISHPALAIVREEDNRLEILRDFGVNDYISRMD